MRLQLLLCFCLLLVFCIVHAQEPTFDIKLFSSQSGYNNTDEITDIQSDRQGFIWIVNFSSIYRYNGKAFKKINTSTAATDEFLRFKETSKGEKYVIDLDGNVFFIEADTLRPYPYNHLLSNLNVHNYFQDVYFDEQGRLHVSFRSTGYCMIDKGKLRYPLKEKRVFLNGYACILRDNELPFIVHQLDSIYPCTYHYYLLDEELNVLDSIPMALEGFSENPSIAKKANGNFLFSSGRGNIFELNTTGFIKEIKFDIPILRLFLDRDHGLWISTRSGIEYYENADVLHKKPIKVNENQFSFVAAQDYEGGIWFSSDHVLGHIRHPKQKVLKDIIGLKDKSQIRALELVNNSLLAATDQIGRISVIDAFNFSQHQLRLDSIAQLEYLDVSTRYFNDLYYDRVNQKLWFTRRGKIYSTSWDGTDDFEIKEIPIPPLARRGTTFHLSKEMYHTPYTMVAHYYNQFLLIEKDSITYNSKAFPKKIERILAVGDSIFVSTSTGLYLQVADKVTYLGEKHAELKKTIYEFTYFQNKVWLSVKSKGLFTLAKDELEEITFQNTSIIDAQLYHPTSDELWIMNDQGSFLHHANKVSKPEQPVLEAYVPYGFSGNAKQSIASATSFYDGTKRTGIGILPFRELKKDTLFPPRLLFSQLKIDGIGRVPTDSTYRLKYNESFIQISYIGISYRGKKIHYKHRMLGLQDEWTETDESYIQFTTLPAGNYSFEIQCRRDGEGWSKSKWLHFEISPPFWKTWWFITLSAILILWTGFQIINYRLRIVQREKTLLVDRLKAEQKALRAQMSPHFIFNIIASIRYIVNSDGKNKVNQFLDMFSSSMRNILNQSNENHITLENEIQFLKEYIEMECFRLEGIFEYEIQQTQLSPYLQKLIPPFVIQPFVENAIQHGLKHKEEHGFLSLRFRVDYPFLEVQIEDNGVGREKANQYKKKTSDASHGIRIIKERLAIHNEKDRNIRIKDLLNDNQEASGTLVVLQIRILEKLKTTK